jgi:hypothetical protein
MNMASSTVAPVCLTRNSTPLGDENRHFRPGKALETADMPEAFADQLADILTAEAL